MAAGKIIKREGSVATVSHQRVSKAFIELATFVIMQMSREMQGFLSFRQVVIESVARLPLDDESLCRLLEHYDPARFLGDHNVAVGLSANERIIVDKAKQALQARLGRRCVILDVMTLALIAQAESYD